jgi:hypothetical protein
MVLYIGNGAGMLQPEVLPRERTASQKSGLQRWCGMPA